MLSFERPYTSESHRGKHLTWLRAAVLGADDGVVSTATLLIGVAASDASAATVLTAGVAALVAGAMSMAAGEYVSVSSQRDAEQADLRKEAAELEAFPEAELDELAQIYQGRGLEPQLAREVAEQLSSGDRLAVHARDELGLSELTMARPIQAAIASAIAFAVGSAVTLLALGLSTRSNRIAVVAAVALLALGILGVLGAVVGGASRTRGALRIMVGGALAMAIGAAVGLFLGGVVT